MSVHVAQSASPVAPIRCSGAVRGGCHCGGCNVPTAAQQGAAPDRKKRHSIRLATAFLVAPLFAAGEPGVGPMSAA